MSCMCIVSIVSATRLWNCRAQYENDSSVNRGKLSVESHVDWIGIGSPPRINHLLGDDNVCDPSK